MTGGLNFTYAKDGLNNKLNRDTFANVYSMTELAGGLVSDGIGYAMTGSMTLNVLNAADFGLGNGGLLELTLGKGAGFRIGSGGTNVSASNIKGVVRGFNEAKKVSSWKYGSIENKTTLNGINAQSYSKIDTDLAFAQDVWSGEKIITYGDIDDDKGRYNSEDGTITMSRKLLGGGIESAAEWAAVASHENAHARGVLEERDAHMSGLATYLGVTKNLGITADDNLVTEMLFGAIMNDNSANEDGVYHWKQTWGGTLVNDGQGWLVDENGMYINIDGTRRDTPKEGETLGAAGIETGLLNIIAGTSGKAWDTFSEEEVIAAQEFMENSGMNPSPGKDAAPEKKTWGYGNNGVKLDMNAFFELAGEDVVSVLFDRYYNNLADLELADAFGVDLMFTSSDINRIVPDSLQNRFTELVGTHLAETSTPAKLVDKYLDTFSKNDDTVISYFRPDENNPFLDQLLGQHNIKSVPAIDNSGCNAMTQLALVQLITGTVFNEPTIASIWNKAVENNYVINSGEQEGFVNSVIGLSKLAFEETTEDYKNFRLDKVSDLTLESVISTRIGVSYHNPDKVGHYILGSPNNLVVDFGLKYNNLYNPGYTIKDQLEIVGYSLYEF